MTLLERLLRHSAEEVSCIAYNTNVMTDYSDIAIGLWIMSNHNPKHFFELGAGTGGWPSAMHNVLGLSDTKFTLVEDMSWGLTDFTYQGESYPKTTNELKQIINQKTFSKMNVEVFQNVDLNDIPKYDTLRLDCETSYEDFEAYINHCNENSVIFIDDFRFNISLKRVAYAMTLASKQKLFPLWFGDQESAWTNNLEYRNHLLRTCYYQIDKIKSLKINPRVFMQDIIGDIDWKYINTRGGNDLLFTKHKEAQ